jgi:hypothetical protein
MAPQPKPGMVWTQSVWILVVGIVVSDGAVQATRSAKMCCQRQRWLQRFQRLKTVV